MSQQQLLCPVCEQPSEDGHSHVTTPVSRQADAPLAFIINLRRYDNAAAVARLLGLARRELKQYFPGKEFEIQPTRMMLTQGVAYSVLLGEAYVATYVAYEK